MLGKWGLLLPPHFSVQSSCSGSESGCPACLGVPRSLHIPPPRAQGLNHVSSPHQLPPHQDVYDSRPCRVADSSTFRSLCQGGKERALGKQRPGQAGGECVCKNLASPSPGTGPPAAELTCPRPSSCPQNLKQLSKASPSGRLKA